MARRVKKAESKGKMFSTKVTGVEVNDFSLIPDGDYVAEIEKVEAIEGKTGTGAKLYFKITEGKHKGRKVNTAIWVESESAVFKVVEFANAIGLEVIDKDGEEYVDFDPKDVVGKECIITVKQSESNPDFNDVKRFKPILDEDEEDESEVEDSSDDDDDEDDDETDDEEVEDEEEDEESADNLDFDELLGELNLDELSDICADLKIKTKRNDNEDSLIDKIVDYVGDSDKKEAKVRKMVEELLEDIEPELSEMDEEELMAIIKSRKLKVGKKATKEQMIEAILEDDED